MMSRVKPENGRTQGLIFHYSCVLPCSSVPRALIPSLCCAPPRFCQTLEFAVVLSVVAEIITQMQMLT